jgi:hypothetical protein
VHEKLTTFLQLAAAVRIFNQRLSLLILKSAAFHWRSAVSSKEIMRRHEDREQDRGRVRWGKVSR